MPDQQIQLTDREKLVAEEAADLAVKKLTAEFYQSVGKTVVARFLTILGGLVVGFFIAHNWKF
ncbi:MAG TPA: hypothetical protein V6C65_03545 [Allocoleopsis sp.]